MKIENLVQIDEEQNVVQIVTRVLTNSKNEVDSFSALYNDYEQVLESNYNDSYKYCLNIFIQNNIVTDLI